MTAKGHLIKLQAAQSAFDLPDDVSYLNTSGFGPRLHAVTRAAHRALAACAQPWAAAPDDWLRQTEALRQLAARVLELNAEQLAYTPSVSYAMALAEKNCSLKRGQNVVVVKGEYPSNRAIWQEAAAHCGGELRMADRQNGECWTDAICRNISKETAVVSIPQCHWADGALLDLARISASAKAQGAALIIDASQSLGMLPIDVKLWQPDFVIAPGHKWLLGAYGLGWLWASDQHCKYGQPLEQTVLARDAMGDFASLGAALPPYRQGARRFDFGPYPHPLSVPMSMAALEQIEAWGISAIRSRLEQLSGLFRNQAERCGLADGLTASAMPHILAWRAPNDAVLERALAVLSNERVIVARRGGLIRMSPHLHISEAQLLRAVQLIGAAI